MKIIIKILIITLSISVFLPENSNGQLNRDQIAEIRRIIEKPLATYKLNNALNDSVFNRTDNFIIKSFSMNLSPQNLMERIKKEGEFKFWLTSDIKLIGSQPVKSDGKDSILITYSSSLHERNFKKDLRKPTKRSLENNDVINISLEFLRNNKFVFETRLDKISGNQVFKRKLDMYLSNTEKIDEFNLLQRAIFDREVSGIKVINSKQIVDIYPDTKEILAYKSLEWTPINERSAQKIDYKGFETIQKEVEKSIDLDREKVEKITPAYFQTNDSLVPVILFDLSNTDRSPGEEIRQFMLILPSKLDIPAREEINAPIKAK